jgi:hypothetical protein
MLTSYISSKDISPQSLSCGGYSTKLGEFEKKKNGMEMENGCGGLTAALYDIEECGVQNTPKMS